MENTKEADQISTPQESKNIPLILGILVSVFTAIIFVMTSLRYMSFLSLNWDLGINMQLLWTNTHGFLLFETADFETSGVRSFLQVNSAYIAIPLSHLYRIWPSAFTLLSIQAFFISLSIVPIYMFTNQRLRDTKISLLVAVIFISGFAVLSGVFYDFHWESFIPLEFFLFVWLISRRKFLLSAIVIIVGSLTLEVFPFLSASYLLYLFIFPEREFFPEEVTKSVIARERVKYLALLVISGIAYYIIGYLGGVVVPNIIGNASTAVSASHSVVYLFNFGITSSTILNSTVYWLLLFMSLGFVPFIKFRSLVVIAPWFYWSTIALPNFYTSQFGNQYGIIAMSVLLIPFIEGLRVIIDRSRRSEPAGRYSVLIGPLSLLILAIGFETTSVFLNHGHLLFFTVVFCIIGIITVILFYKGTDLKNTSLRVISARPLSRKFMIQFLLIVVVIGLVIGPLNPINTSAEGTGGYSVSFSVNPSYTYMGEISTIVGHNNTVLTTDNLFPYVANNPNAYSFFWYPRNYTQDQYFPFNSTNLPNFLLIDDSQMFTVPSYFSNIAFNTTSYGLVYEIENSNYPGNIYLFELGYHGNITTRTS